MPRLSFAAAVSLIPVIAFVIALSGCEKQEQCVAADTPEVCQAFRECLKASVSIEVCRMGEKDASQWRRDLAPAYNGAADALKSDSSPKVAPQPSPKH
jgi:uncharacterized protein YgiB involved in biofilm formation